jgi:hypothetical protein
VRLADGKAREGREKMQHLGIAAAWFALEMLIFLLAAAALAIGALGLI